MLEIILASLWGYLLGAVPTGVLVSRTLAGVDPRVSGSAHTGGLNVSRTAGLGAGVLTGIIDTLLGLGAVAGANLLFDNPWAITAAGVMAVVGHNWSLFIGFGGGIGLSKLAGALLGLSPLIALEAALILLLLWFFLIKSMRVHRARATIITMIGVGPLLWAVGSSALALAGIALGVLGGVVVILKTLPDWNRTYRSPLAPDDKSPGAQKPEALEISEP